MLIAVLFVLVVWSICRGIRCLGSWGYCSNFECSASGKTSLFNTRTWSNMHMPIGAQLSAMKICSNFLSVSFQGGHIIFFQSLSLLGYCLFPLDVGALVCMLKNNVVLKIVVVTITLAWSSWAAYPFMSAAVNPRRKALALYPVFLMYISVGFLIIAID